MLKEPKPDKPMKVYKIQMPNGSFLGSRSHSVWHRRSDVIVTLKYNPNAPKNCDIVEYELVEVARYPANPT